VSTIIAPNRKGVTLTDGTDGIDTLTDELACRLADGLTLADARALDKAEETLPEETDTGANGEALAEMPGTEDDTPADGLLAALDNADDTPADGLTERDADDTPRAELADAIALADVMADVETEADRETEAPTETDGEAETLLDANGDALDNRLADPLLLAAVELEADKEADALDEDERPAEAKGEATEGKDDITELLGSELIADDGLEDDRLLETLTEGDADTIAETDTKIEALAEGLTDPLIEALTETELLNDDATDAPADTLEGALDADITADTDTEPEADAPIDIADGLALTDGREELDDGRAEELLTADALAEGTDGETDGLADETVGLTLGDWLGEGLTLGTDGLTERLADALLLGEMAAEDDELTADDETLRTDAITDGLRELVTEEVVNEDLEELDDEELEEDATPAAGVYVSTISPGAPLPAGPLPPPPPPPP
jgi:hypothetical protein